MKPTLQLPITLRPPEMEEVPMNSSSVRERLKLRKTAKIVEGFKILPKDNNSEPSSGARFSLCLLFCQHMLTQQQVQDKILH